MKKTASMAASAWILGACSSATLPPAPPPAIGMANPASQFCVQQGGTLRIVSTAAGEHGICVLPDGREVEEWTLYRQHHDTPSAK